jgi:protein-S-isoprenylcysteine O-methyltransferase Ste14
MAGTLMLTVFHWAGPSHTYFQQNWTYVFYVPLVVVGTALTLWGVLLIGRAVRDSLTPQVKVARLKTV